MSNEGQRAVDFINCLSTSTGEPFALRDWQADIVRTIIGTTRTDTGRRQYTDVGLWLPRGNGKTELAAAMTLERFFREPTRRGEYYCAAYSRDQAALLFNSAVAIIQDKPELLRLVDIVPSKKLVMHRERGSVFRCLANEHQGLHGLRPNMVVMDELHTLRDRDSYVALQTALGKKREPLMITITTAGLTGETYLEYELYSYAKRVRAGVIEDAAYLPVIFEIEQDEDWQDEKVWHRVNPALGDFRSLDEMRRLAARAREMPRYENDFRRFYLNQHVSQTSRWLPLDDWTACERETLPDPTGPWFAGVDLSAKIDLTSLALVARCGSGYVVKGYNWMPEETAQERERQDKVPYTQWQRAGWVDFTPGNRVDQEYINERIGTICRQHGCDTIAIDPHNAEWQYQAFKRQGFDCREAGQNYRTLSEPAHTLEALVKAEQFWHTADQCIAWQVESVEALPNSDGRLIRPVKGSARGRIDCVVAMVMAVALASTEEAAAPAVH